MFNLLPSKPRPSWRGYFSAFFLGAAVTAIIATWAAIVCWPVPERVIEVIENPAPQERETLPTIREARNGTLTGRVELPLPSTLPAPSPSPDSTTAPVPTPPGVPAGTVVTVPVQGEIHTTYVDAKTDQVIGQGVHQVAGVTTVEIQPGSVSVETVFDDATEIALRIPAKPPPANRIGVELGLDGWAGYYRRDWRLGGIGRFDLIGFGRVGFGSEFCLSVGLEVAF